MSDAKPYTTERLDAVLSEWEQGGKPRFASADLRATVRALDAAQAEVTALRAEAKERQRVLEQAIEEQMSALSERNWANERHEEAVAENAALKARVAELEALHESLGASLRKVGQDGLASVVDLTRERDEWKAKAEALMGRAG